MPTTVGSINGAPKKVWYTTTGVEDLQFVGNFSSSNHVGGEICIEKIYDDIVYGRNAVLELLKSNKDINKIHSGKGEFKFTQMNDYL